MQRMPYTQVPVFKVYIVGHKTSFTIIRSIYHGSLGSLLRQITYVRLQRLVQAGYGEQAGVCSCKRKYEHMPRKRVRRYHLSSGIERKGAQG
jgi:hypothetical protein